MSFLYVSLKGTNSFSGRRSACQRLLLWQRLVYWDAHEKVGGVHWSDSTVECCNSGHTTEWHVWIGIVCRYEPIHLYF